MLTAHICCRSTSLVQQTGVAGASRLPLPLSGSYKVLQELTKPKVSGDAGRAHQGALGRSPKGSFPCPQEQSQGRTAAPKQPQAGLERPHQTQLSPPPRQAPTSPPACLETEASEFILCVDRAAGNQLHYLEGSGALPRYQRSCREIKAQ